MSNPRPHCEVQGLVASVRGDRDLARTVREALRDWDWFSNGVGIQRHIRKLGIMKGDLTIDVRSLGENEPAAKATGVYAALLEAASGGSVLELAVHREVSFDGRVLAAVLGNLATNQSAHTNLGLERAKKVTGSRISDATRKQRREPALWRERWNGVIDKLVRGNLEPSVEALQRLGLPDTFFSAALESWLANAGNLVVDVRPAAEEGSLRVDIDSSGREVSVTLTAAEEHLECSEERAWDLLLWTYCSWFSSPHTFRERSRKTVPKELRVTSVSIHERGCMHSAVAGLDDEKLREYSQLLAWLRQFPLARRRQGRPGEQCSVDALDDERTFGLMQHLDPAPIRLLEFQADHSSVSLDGRLATRDANAGRAIVRGEPGLFSSLPPIDVVEILSRGNLTDKFQDFAALRSAGALTHQTASAWAWLRLLWRRKRLVEFEEARRGMNFLLGSTRTRSAVTEGLVPGLRFHQARSPESVVIAERIAPIWIVDFAHEWQGPGRVPVCLKASIVTISVQPPTRLMHFDGKPEFSPEDWLRIVRVALALPNGTVWFEPHRLHRSNRLDLVAPNESADWYSTNHHYRSANPGEREQYREALRHIRQLALRVGNQPPAPWSTTDELRKLHRAVARVVHPDARGTAEDVGGAFRQMQEAFRIVRPFHET